MVESGKFSKVQLIGAAALVVVAIVVGLGIRALRRDHDAAVETARIAKQAVPAQSSAGTSPVSLVEAVAEVNEVKPVVEAVPTQVEDANIAAVPAAEAKPVVAMAELLTDVALYMRVFGDFNWTDEESNRFRAGMNMAVAQYRNMTPQDRERVDARIERMQADWDSMDPAGHEDWLWEIRDGLEQWRRSDDVELPAPQTLWIGIGLGRIEVPGYEDNS